MRQLILIIISLTLIFTFLTNCQAEDEHFPLSTDQLVVLDYAINSDPDRSAVYFSTVRKVQLEVVYEEGAAPETGMLLSVQDIWDITQVNLEKVFATRDYAVHVEVPKEPSSDMREIPSQGKREWTSVDLVSFANTFRTKNSNFEETVFFVAFVRGKLQGSNGGVIGSTYSGFLGLGAPVVFIFKDVIETFPRASRKNAEQRTVVHELGHALGLVNSGIPMTSEHQDVARGAHCTNEKCAMYYSVNLRKIDTESPYLYGPECYQDIKEFRP
ncbi:hypothetical protein CH373_04475 [Leptospira perolatii]|uniref:Peptidase M43 pregnancy-associated plasma-A domain-containing protein n=1 Tax=Leptospira perolatii TaxID=2023191 RepID=A0A2M9ZQ26_9LEPT|nr:hypothetical protein [Leptospira perolatii]PJZ68252.1 hypothetical protein CH360_17200 [Leptospira perolatii]PJZ74177.1 hypothetical protein CH373_04475 [Leptospira perolatii]